MNSMSSTIENGLQRQAALPHFLPHFHRIFTEFNSLKILNFELPNYSRIFFKLWIRRVFWREFTEFNSLDLA